MEIMKRGSKRGKRGLVLPVIAAIAICLALLGLGVLRLGFGSRIMAARTVSGVSARAAADAGITRALYELNHNFTMGDIPIETLMPPDVSDQPLNNSNATYSYKVRAFTTELPEPYWLIESIGKLGTQQKTVYATLGVRNRFDYGLIVTDFIDLKSNNLIDGYDTRRNMGLYTEPPDYTNSHAYIRIGTTSIADNAILLKQDTEVTGDILVGVGGVVDDVIRETPVGGSITGPWYNLPEPWYFEPIEITVPDGPYETFPNIVGPSFTLGSPGTTEYHRYNEIDLSNGKIVIIAGHVELRIKGLLRLKNSAKLIVGDPLVDPAASVIIYLDGDLTVGQSGEINNLSKIPINFQLYGTTQSSQAWDISNEGDYFGIYYGPNANIITKAKADFYGSISGHEFTLHNDGAVHYDHALSGLIGHDTGFGIDRLWEKSDFVAATGL